MWQKITVDLLKQNGIFFASGFFPCLSPTYLTDECPAHPS